MIFCIFKHIKSNIILINMGKVRRCRQYNQPPIAIREGVMISSQNITRYPLPIPAPGWPVPALIIIHEYNEFSISLLSGLKTYFYFAISEELCAVRAPSLLSPCVRLIFCLVMSDPRDVVYNFISRFNPTPEFCSMFYLIQPNTPVFTSCLSLLGIMS